MLAVVVKVAEVVALLAGRFSRGEAEKDKYNTLGESNYGITT